MFHRIILLAVTSYITGNRCLTPGIASGNSMGKIMNSQSAFSLQFALLRDLLASQLYDRDALAHRHIFERFNSARGVDSHLDSNVVQCNTLSFQRNADNLAILNHLSSKQA